jgi:hypothetical protein
MSAAATSISSRSIIESPAPHRSAAHSEFADETQRRLDFLLTENADYERRNALYRTSREEFEALSMRDPQTTAQSYRMLGMLLGAFAPAAYFSRMGNYGLPTIDHPGNPVLVFFFILMNAICILVGLNIGTVVGKRMEKMARASWTKLILYSLLMALFWAAVTGAAGGAIIFVVGGIFGIFFALPVALAAFPAFAIAHRLLERGHLIERKHLLPVAFGISLAISAFILGLH